MVRRIVAAFALLLLLTAPAVPAFAQSSGCQFVLGFKAIHDAIPTVVGSCQDNEHPAGAGEEQHTAGGLMAWRKADNWTAFTDGYHTWVNGPNGLQERLNTQRFSWEGNPDSLPLADNTTAPAPAPTPAPSASGSAVTQVGVTASPDNLAGHSFYASTYHPGPGTTQAHTVYCDTDPGWQKLSPNYLAKYPTYTAAVTELPSFYVLHQPC